MKTPGKTFAWILSAMVPILAGCSFPDNSAQLTLGPATHSAMTVEAILTKAYAPSGTPTASPFPLPATPGTIQPPTQETPTSQSGTCTDRATFVADATISDNTILEPGQAFLKVWTLKNSGTCIWDSSYALSFISGDRMGAATEISLAQIVSPDEIADLGVDMIAPASPGVFQGFWRLKNSTGLYFGIGPSGDQSFWVKIVVPSTATPTATSTPSPSASVTTSPSPTLVQSTNTSTPTETPTATGSPMP